MQTLSKVVTSFLSLFCVLGFSQTLTENQLLEIWSINDKTQTKAALQAYNDLTDNYNDKKYTHLISSVKSDINSEKDLRKKIRLVLYEATAYIFVHQNLNTTLKKELEECIKSALIIEDNQLLSEIYSLYYEQGFGDPNEKLYYITKTVEIQEQIGTEYFPKLFFRYYNLSLGYYRSQDYYGSIQKGEKGLALLNSPTEYLDYYCFFLDILGTNYDEIGNPKQSLFYYNELKKTLSEYKKNHQNYQGRFSTFDSKFYEIWDGIANGGLARILIQKGEYENAKKYLEQNLQTSEKHNLDDDIAKILNLLGDIELKQQQPKTALDYYQKSLIYSRKSKDSKDELKSLLAISNSYRDLQQFENAYDYSIQYYNKKAEIEKEISKRQYSSISEKLKQEDLKSTINDAQATIKKQKTSRNINLLLFTVVVLGICILSGVLYYRQKLKFSASENKRLNTEIELEESKREIKIAEIQLTQFRQKLAQNSKIIEAIEKEDQPDSEALSQLKETTILTNEDWSDFKKQFAKAYPNFLNNLKVHHAELSQSELRYLCLAQLGLTSSEIASALGISPASLRVTKHRIRKKIGEENEIFPYNLLQSQD